MCFHMLLCEVVLIVCLSYPTPWNTLKGPFTHAIFDAISDAISRAKRALPYPARMLFSRSIVWIGKKVITYCFKTPFIPISANLVVFCRSVTRLKTRAGLAGAGFVRKIASKSHRNRMKNRMCKPRGLYAAQEDRNARPRPLN